MNNRDIIIIERTYTRTTIRTRGKRQKTHVIIEPEEARELPPGPQPASLPEAVGTAEQTQRAVEIEAARRLARRRPLRLGRGGW